MKRRAENVLQFSELEALKLLVADLYCITSYQSLDHSAVMIEKSRPLWCPIVDLCVLISTSFLLVIQHVIVAVSTLPKVGDVDESHSKIIKSIVQAYPSLKILLSLVLFCATAVFYSSLTAILFCCGLFCYQQCVFYAHSKKVSVKRSIGKFLFIFMYSIL